MYAKHHERNIPRQINKERVLGFNQELGEPLTFFKKHKYTRTL